MSNYRRANGEARKTREYRAWAAMRARCNNPNVINYERYGGRGIRVCKRWDDYRLFLLDMGRCPPGCTLERMDNGEGYSPGNCTWATRSAQVRNRRTSLMVDYGGKRWNFADLVDAHGRDYMLVYNRVFRYRWTMERALHA